MAQRILILCTGNSARSQMAEGLVKSFDAGLDVRSAGTKPASRVHPAAVEAMREIGIDIAAARPKSVGEFLDQPFDFVITVCDDANETCPVFTGRVRRRVHLGFRDPAAAEGGPDEILLAFRQVRDQIAGRLREFWREEIATASAWTLRPAVAADLDAVRALLVECKLPGDGLADQFPASYVLAEARDGPVGVAGVEVYGGDGLLRSVAVAQNSRTAGLGAALVGAALEQARKRRLEAVYLLTTSAADYFPRFGFGVVSRDSAPATIRACPQFAAICPASAVLMRLGL